MVLTFLDATQNKLQYVAWGSPQWSLSTGWANICWWWHLKAGQFKCLLGVGSGCWVLICGLGSWESVFVVSGGLIQSYRVACCGEKQCFVIGILLLLFGTRLVIPSMVWVAWFLGSWGAWWWFWVRGVLVALGYWFWVLNTIVVEWFFWLGCEILVELMDLLSAVSENDDQLVLVKGSIDAIYACPSPPREGDGWVTCMVEMMDWRHWYCLLRVLTLSERLS